MHSPKNLLFLCLVWASCLGQATWAGSPVWLVENSQNKLYLAGTIHLLRPTDYPLPQALNYAYQQAQILVFETDINSSSDPTFTRQMAEAMLLPPDQQLQDLLSASTLAMLEDYLQANHLTLAQFARLKPAMIALTLTLTELGKIGAGNNGVDRHFFERASADSKVIKALETPLQQLEFLSSLGEGQEDLVIQHTLEDIKTLQQQFDNMIQSWRVGDYDRLQALFIEPMRTHFNPLYQQLLVQRNENWLPEIVQMLSSEETEMILVGTAHLLGEEGLVSRLHQTGFKITPLD